MTRLAAWKITTTVTGTGVINCKMKKTMKKITYLLIAAITLVSVASCVKDQFENFGPEASFGNNEFIVSLSPATRTMLDEGKTLWAEGDMIWVSNGAAVDTIEVPESAIGEKEFAFKTVNATPTEANPKVWVVYPVDAAKQIADGKVVVDIPAVQKGTFETANICAGESKEGVVALRNVTGILKVTVPQGTAARIFQLVMSGAGQAALSGECTVDLSGEAPVVTAAKTSSSVTVKAAGFDGDFFAAVIPGTYEAGFKLTAATVDFEHASETKVSTAANTVAINQIVDLGEIGTNLKPMDGDGSEASPYLIENLGHLIALSTAVDKGESFAGKFFKVINDIDGISTCVGSTEHPFCGNFDGDAKTLTLTLSGANNLGLFGVLGGNANIHNVKLAGEVVSSSNSVGALAGQIKANEATPITIKDVTSDASVSGGNYVGGIVGYSTGGDATITIENCVNNGTIQGGSYRVGGIAGGMLATSTPKTIKNCINNGSVTSNSFCAGGIVGYFANAIQDSNGTLAEEARVKNVLDGCSNTAAVTSKANNGNHYYRYRVSGQSSTYLSNYTVGNTDRGTGGIVGYAAQTNISNCTNSGSIDAVNKAGGIAGFICFADIDDSNNSGSVNVTSYVTGSVRHEGLAGGIAGGSLGSDHIKLCKNSGDIYGYASVGGIIGFAMGGNANGTSGKPATAAGNAPFVVDSCYNSGTIKAKYAEVGGIAGVCYALNGTNKGYVKYSTNNGTVLSEGTKAGGIVGVLIDDTGWSRPGAEECINNGSVTAQRFVGGIAGYGSAIAGMHTSNASDVGLVTHRFWIANCQNNGTILATRTDDGNKDAGGIIGTCFFGSNKDAREYMGIELYNVLNTGDVLYADASHQTVYCGGIVGRFGRGCIYNAVNSGRVGPQSGDPAEDVNNYMGALCGTVEATANRICKISGGYYQEGVAPLAYGSKSTTTNPEPVNVITFGETGTLSAIATVNNQDYTVLVEALNAWVNNRPAYLNWAWSGGIKLVWE